MYSSALAPELDIQTFICVDMGLLAPDLVVYIDTAPTTIRARPQISTLFSELEFQEPGIWEGVRVLRHQTCDNKWESRNRLMSSLRGDPLWKGKARSWNDLWEDHGTCGACLLPFQSTEECQRCMERLHTVHQFCLIETRSYERIPLNSACQTPAPASTDPPPPLPQPVDPPSYEEDPGEEKEPEVPADADFTTRLQETGSTPCKVRGVDHLSRDRDCEFWKRALGPMYRHLKDKYGTRIADYTPTFSFDFRARCPRRLPGPRCL